MSEVQEQQLRGMVTLLKGAMNAWAAALDEDLNDAEVNMIAKAHLDVRNAICELRRVSDLVASVAVRRALREGNE